MSIEFIKLINDYIIDATLDISDEDILSSITQDATLSWDMISRSQAFLHKTIEGNRQARLTQKKAEYQTYKTFKDNALKITAAQRTLNDMLSDIVMAIQNDTVPKPISMAFREQSKTDNDDAIRQIWKSLVELGLINLDDETD